MTDELNKDRKGGCGHRENKAEWDSSVVADVLDIVKIRDIKARTTQPIWMNIWVPQSAKAGKYKGTLTVTGKNASPMELQIEVDVLNRTLPAPRTGLSIWTYGRTRIPWPVTTKFLFGVKSISTLCARS